MGSVKHNEQPVEHMISGRLCIGVAILLVHWVGHREDSLIILQAIPRTLNADLLYKLVAVCPADYDPVIP